MATPVDVLPRNQASIVQRIREIDEVAGTRDPFGVERSRLLDALDWAHAQQFLKDGVGFDEAAWEAGDRRIRNVSDVKAQMAGHLDFAFIKANACKGIAVARSLAHFRGLAWLAAAGELFETLDEDEMRFYGKPKLVAVANYIGFDWRSVDDDQWVEAPNDEPLTADDALA